MAVMHTESPNSNLEARLTPKKTSQGEIRALWWEASWVQHNHDKAPKTQWWLKDCMHVCMCAWLTALKQPYNSNEQYTADDMKHLKMEKIWTNIWEFS